MKFNLLFLIIFVTNGIVAQIPENTPTNSTNGVFYNSNVNPNSNAETITINRDTIVDVEKINVKSKISTKDKYRGEAIDSDKLEEKSEQSKGVQQKEVISSDFKKTKMAVSTQNNQRSPTPQQQQQMDAQVDELKTIDPNSFEYHLLNYSSGNYDVKREESLKKAVEIQPKNPDVLKLSAANSIVKGDTLSAKKQLNQLVFQQVIQPETIDYTKDVLKSTKANSTLITHGFNDTYGAYQNQLNQGEKKTVEIVSLDFLQSQAYRNLLANKGYVVPIQKDVNVNFLKMFCEQNRSKNISISMTLPKEYFIPIQDKIYPVGLVFEYRTTQQTTSCLELEDLWYNQFNKKVITSYKTELSNGFSSNYIPMLIYLKNFYEANQDVQNATKMDATIQQIELKTGRKYPTKKNR